MTAWQPGYAVGRGDDPGVDDTEAKAGNPFAKGSGNPFGKGKNDKPVGDGKKTPGKLKCRFCTADATKRVRRVDMPKGMGACDKHVALARSAGKRVLGVDDLTKDDEESKADPAAGPGRKGAPGVAGEIGPGPEQLGQPHVYARDPESGGGNCVCGGPPDDPLHRPSPLAPESKAARRGSAGPPRFAGLAVMAADTGRVLMLQRAIGDPTDPAAGTWEFPGGGIEDGDDSTLHGAMREWSEEVGQPVPRGGTVAHVWTSPNGVYQGHLLVIPEEAGLDLAKPRTVDNPDDDSEQVAWWSLAHAQRNPALRTECRAVPWRQLAQIAGQVRRGAGVQSKAAPPPRDPAARRQRLADQDAAAALAAQSSGGRKRKVASPRGEERYGLPIGSEIGKARDAKAEQVQRDPKARASYDKLLTANPRQYNAMLDDMSDDELGRLTQVAYSFRSSNPNVVQARLALAAALRRRGKDVADYGGLGRRAASSPAARPRPGGPDEKRARPEISTKSLPQQDGTWLPGEAWWERAERRTLSGLMGKSLPPGEVLRYGEGGQPMRLHVYGDGSWQFKAAGAGELVASGGGYRVDADPVALARVIEAKVMSPDPRAARLRNYWAHGPGRRKWRPGSKGDFKRLRRQLARHVPAHVLNGLTANIHKLATGEWPGRNAHTGKKADPTQQEWTDLSHEDLIEAAMLDPADPSGRGPDDDAVSTALDRYADIAGQLTAEQEYEAALAREVVWDLMSDGSVLGRDDGFDDDDHGWFDDDDDEPDPVATLTDLFADSL